MAIFSKQNLSAAGVGGLPIEVTASGEPGTLLHTAVSGADLFDEVWLYGINHTGAQLDLALEWGGTASGHFIEVGVPPQQGLLALTPGLPVSGGVAVRAHTTQAGVSGISILGFVNRIDQS